MWSEVGERVFVSPGDGVNPNVGLIVGAAACVVVDTRMTHPLGRAIADAVRQVTALPWTVVNTHGHYDHCFGNHAFLPAEIWGHERCAEMLRRDGPVKRAYFAAGAEPPLAAELAAVEIVPPDRTFATEARLDLGGRTVHLRHLGRGHTDNDVVVEIPDAAVLFAGDLVEEGYPPVFGDAFPLDWPLTMEAVAALAAGAVVPGHGKVVDAMFVREQGATLARTAEVARAAFAAGRTVDDAWRDTPLPEDFARQALDRAYRQLRGDPAYDPPGVLAARLGVTA
ncbi:MBL fold metallo-hydrolase [Phytohabitans sp. LJ34]|uniref:MBL fold metallo-hydrolase n=1 Tax=Phytohabitans sp. LJ34 TaxID=3452217 RepID=UPI003F8BC31F